MQNWVRLYLVAVAVTVFGIVIAGRSFAAEAPKEETQAVTLTIKDHVFIPTNIEVPANQKITITVDNQDTTPEEFESHDLHREKVIAAGSKATILVGPLNAGVYKFVGEYHEDTAKGIITVK